MWRYLRIYLFLLSRHYMTEMEYRINFLTNIASSLFGFVSTVVFFQILYLRVDNLAGWTKYEVLLLLGIYLLVKGIFDTTIKKGLDRLPRLVRRGSWDGYLLKPLNSLFQAIINKLDFDDLVQIIIATLVMVYALGKLSLPIGWVNWAAFFLMFFCALVILLANYLLIMTTAFWTTQVPIDEIYKSFLQINRIPLDIFSRRVQIFFTYLVPLSFLVLFPTQALLGKLSSYLLLVGPIFAGFHFFLAVKFWHLGLRHYGSASS